MKIKARLISVALLLIITLTALAQKRERQTVVLIDGTRLVGTIVADSSGYLRFKIRSPRVITINKSQVYSTGNVVPGMTGSVDKEGYSIRLSASLLAGRNSTGKVGTASIHLSNGYQFRNGLNAGLGTGIEKFDILLMPLYADLRYQPFKTRVSPYAWLKTGYGFALSEQVSDDNYYYGYYRIPKGGVMFGTGAGIALYSWERNAVSIGVGYRYQKLRYRHENNWGGEPDSELITHFNRIEIQFGFIFR